MVLRATFMTLLLVANSADASMGHCENPEARKVSFVSSEATIGNLDVSPDGRSVAFDALGDIYVVPIDGGTAKTVVMGGAWDARPVWSPDGQKLVFVSDRSGDEQAFSVELGNPSSIRQLTFGEEHRKRTEGTIGSVEWMPDASEIVVDGRRYTILGRPSGYISARADFRENATVHSSAGTLFVVSPLDHDSLEKYGLELSSWSVQHQSLVSLGKVTSTSPLLSGGEIVSRDGRWLIAHAKLARDGTNKGEPESSPSAYGVLALDRLKGGARTIVAPGLSPGWRGDTQAPFMAKGRYAITPDSKYLVIAYGNGMFKVSLNTGESTKIPLEIHVNQCMPAKLRNKIRISSDDLVVKNLRWIGKRPGHEQFAFSALRAIYVQNEGERPRQLLKSFPHGQFQPAYSPDGEWIAFVSWSEVDGGGLWVVAAEGGVPRKLSSTPGYFQSPAWSPDGSRIAYMMDDDVFSERVGYSSIVHGSNLEVVALRDSVRTRLPVRARFGSVPSFSKTGDVIYYSPYEDGARFGGGARIRLTDGVATEVEFDERLKALGASSITIAPDGTLAAVVKSGNIYVLLCGNERTNKAVDPLQCTASRLTIAGGNDPRWSPDGATLEWSFANTHSSVSLEKLLSDIRSKNASLRIAPRQELVTDEIVEVAHVSVTRPRAKAIGTLAITGAKIITMRGSEVIQGGTILIKDGRIRDVGPDGEVLVPKNAEVIEASGKTIIPGLIDIHAHLDMRRDLLDANNGQMLANLAFGITTVRDPSHGGDYGHAYAELVEAGVMIGPRRFGAEGIVPDTTVLDTFEDALGVARRARDLGGSFLKYHSGWNREKRRWIVEAARRTGLNVAAHYPAQNYLADRLDLSTIYDGVTTSEHYIADYKNIAADVVGYIAKSGVGINFASIAVKGGYPSKYWDVVQSDPRMANFYFDKRPKQLETDSASLEGDPPPLAGFGEEQARYLAAIMREGGNVSVGSHGNYNAIGFHFEMWAYARGGMTNHDVLRAATINGARDLGVEQDLGSIAPGKIADLLILRSDPLENIHNTLKIEKVVTGGRVRVAENLTETWPDRKPLPAWRSEFAHH